MTRLFRDIKAELALVLEDDCSFLSNPVVAIENAINDLPADFDLLFLGGNVHKPAIKYSEHLYRLTACVGNHAVLYTRRVMDELAAAYETATQPTDMIVDKQIVQAGKSYITSPLLAVQYPGFSDIEQKETDYQSLLIDRYHKNVS